MVDECGYGGGPALAVFVADWVPLSWGSDRFAVEVSQWLCSDVPSVLLDRVVDPELAGELTEAADLLAFYRTLPMEPPAPLPG